MLIANKVDESMIGGGSSNGRVGIGETVMVKTTNQVGKVVGYMSGQWEVRMDDGNVVMISESQLEVRQVLLG